jgi:acetyl esterase/lipase
VADGNGRRTVRYGDLRAQVGDLWLPPDPDRPPVLVLVHGGFWRPLYRRDLMTGMARAATAKGWAAWNIEYRRPGLFGGGGGWPATPDDVEAAVRLVGSLPSVDPRRVAICGHSAGGQLALAAAATVAGSPDGGTTIVAAISLAGVLDLDAAARLNLGGGAAQAFLGGGPDKVPDRYRACSPAALLPLRVPQLVVHGTLDTVVPPSMSEDYSARAREAGDDVTYAPLPGAGHRDVIAPSGAAWDTLAGYLTTAFGA